MKAPKSEQDSSGEYTWDQGGRIGKRTHKEVVAGVPSGTLTYKEFRKQHSEGKVDTEKLPPGFKQLYRFIKQNGRMPSLKEQSWVESLDGVKRNAQGEPYGRDMAKYNNASSLLKRSKKLRRDFAAAEAKGRSEARGQSFTERFQEGSGPYAPWSSGIGRRDLKPRRQVEEEDRSQNDRNQDDRWGEHLL